MSSEWLKESIEEEQENTAELKENVKILLFLFCFFFFHRIQSECLSSPKKNEKKNNKKIETCVMFSRV